MSASSVSRVLHVCEPTHSGAALVSFRLAAGLRSEGVEPVVLTPPGRLAGWCEQAGIETVELPFARRSPMSYARSIALIRRLVSEGDFSVIHAHSSFSGLLVRVAGDGSFPPIVFQPHAWSWLAVRPALQAPLKLIERGLARRTDLLVCVSAEELAIGTGAGVRARRAEVIPNGVPFPSDVRSRPQPSVPPLGGVIGRLSRQKGIDVLIRAAASAEWPAGLSIEVVGMGSQGEELKSLARKLGVAERVRFLGYCDEPRVHLERWDLFVLPSRYEGAALALLDALAAGLVVVATRVASVQELMPGSRFTVPVEDPLALARALADVLDDWPRATEEAAGYRQRAALAYSLDVQLERTLDAYRMLVAYRDLVAPES